MSPTDRSDHKQDLSAVSILLDRSVDELDQETLTALSRARADALQQLHKPARKPVWQGWLWPAGGLATAVAAGLTAIMLSSGPINPGNDLEASEFEILASNDTLEVIEDLEFYQWLTATAHDDPGDAG